MPAHLEPVSLYRKYYVCDDCGKDELQFTGQALQGNPPMLQHICPKCRAIKHLPEMYPGTIMTPVGGKLPPELEELTKPVEQRVKPKEPSKIIVG